MPWSCTICKKGYSKGVNLFGFPKNEPKLTQWCDIVRSVRAGFTRPGRNDKICSDHFTGKDYYADAEMYRKMGMSPPKKLNILPSAIPSISIETAKAVTSGPTPKASPILSEQQDVEIVSSNVNSKGNQVDRNDFNRDMATQVNLSLCDASVSCTNSVCNEHNLCFTYEKAVNHINDFEDLSFSMPTSKDRKHPKMTRKMAKILQRARDAAKKRRKRQNPLFRLREQMNDTERHRVVRQDPKYRQPEQMRDMHLRRLARQDPYYRERERIRNTQLRRFARHNPEFKRYQKITELDYWGMIAQNYREITEGRYCPCCNQPFETPTNPVCVTGDTSMCSVCYDSIKKEICPEDFLLSKGSLICHKKLNRLRKTCISFPIPFLYDVINIY